MPRCHVVAFEAQVLGLARSMTLVGVPDWELGGLIRKCSSASSCFLPLLDLVAAPAYEEPRRLAEFWCCHCLTEGMRTWIEVVDILAGVFPHRVFVDVVFSLGVGVS